MFLFDQHHIDADADADEDVFGSISVGVLFPP